MTDKLPIEPTEREQELIEIRETLIKNGMIERIFDPVAKKNCFTQTKQGLITLLAYKELTNDLDDQEIPASAKVIADCKQSTEYDQIKQKLENDEHFIVKQNDWETGNSKFFPTPEGHEVMSAMLFWIDEKKQKTFHKALRWKRRKESVGNWARKELNPTKIMQGMVKTSVKMGQVADGMSKFAGETQPKKKRKLKVGR